MQRKVPLALNEYYHVYNRGVEKRKIFLGQKDYDRFLKLLYLTNGDKPCVYRLVQGLPLKEIDVGKKRVAIGAYVLMPNHFHILVREIREGGISAFMEKLQTAYAMYFNKKNERVGALFQGTFKAEHVARDEHLNYLFAYIHLNPVKIIDSKWTGRSAPGVAAARKHLGNYTYSSYHEYVGSERDESAILNREAFPEYFSTPKKFENFLDDWLEYAGEIQTEPSVRAGRRTVQG